MISSSFERSENKEELQRQMNYLNKAKDHTLQLESILGRVPTFHVYNYGCQMNARDAEKLSGVLTQAGYKETKEDNADFVIFNTCTVRDNADQHFYGNLGIASHYKKANPLMKIAVCGCLSQGKETVEKLRRSYPCVDLIFGTYNLFCFPEYLCLLYEDEKGDFTVSHPRMTVIWDKTDEVVEGLPTKRKYSFKSGVNIMYGCDNYCTYCIVPYVRGHERSREKDDIIHECRKLAGEGVVEVMLLGQNVDTYGRGLEHSCSFAELLEEIAGIDGIKRIRFMTPHPKDISEDVLLVMQKNSKIARQVHFPLQSGSNRILRKMNRQYTKEQYIERAAMIRNIVPDAAITTDIIAGFPGETKEDVDDTIDVIEKVQFESAYTFIYSPRRGTPAAKMEPLSKEEVQDNFNRILEVVKNVSSRQAKKHTGTIECALAEEVDPQDKSKISCRLSNNYIVHVQGDASMIGKFYQVRLDTCKNFYFLGEVLEENRRGW